MLWADTVFIHAEQECFGSPHYLLRVSTSRLYLNFVSVQFVLEKSVVARLLEIRAYTWNHAWREVVGRREYENTHREPDFGSVLITMFATPGSDSTSFQVLLKR